MKLPVNSVVPNNLEISHFVSGATGFSVGGAWGEVTDSLQAVGATKMIIDSD